jgi:hypothetical protein
MASSRCAAAPGWRRHFCERRRTPRDQTRMSSNAGRARERAAWCRSRSLGSRPSPRLLWRHATSQRAKRRRASLCACGPPQPSRLERPRETRVAWARGSPGDVSWSRSAAGREPIAGGRAPDQPADQTTAAERQWRKHVLAAVATDLSIGCGPVVRCLLRETPHPRRHPIPPESHPTPARKNARGRFTP